MDATREDAWTVYIPRVHFPDSPSLLRKVLLAPAALFYAACVRVHRALFLRPSTPHADSPPLVVIGGLRAGGSGKTGVTRELARHLQARGWRVGVLAYSIHGRGSGRTGISDPVEVFADSDWRESSDEAVLLARGLAGSGARVFVTRNRSRARDALGRTEVFDVLISDDGLMDTRLQGVLRVALVRPGENPGVLDLLPAGPYRLTARALARADIVLCEGEGFVRVSTPPEGGLAEQPVWILCGLGHPDAFVHALRQAGVRVAGVSAGPDHGLPDLETALKAARAAGVERFLCSEKDAIKLETHPLSPAKRACVGEAITLDPKFLVAVEAFLSRPTS